MQGLSGFAFGMVAMSFWVWVLDPRLAAVLVVFGSLFGQLVAVFSVRRGFDLQTLLPFLVGGLMGIPLGVWLLPSLDIRMFKLFIGTLLVIWCPLMLFSDRIPAVRGGGRLAGGLVGLAGGVMGGLGGFSGVVVTLWCTLRRLEKDTQRSIVQNFNLSVLTVTMLSYLATGIVTVAMWPQLLTVGLVLLVPALIGARVYIGLSQEAFRRVVLSLLSLSGAVMLINVLAQSS